MRKRPNSALWILVFSVFLVSFGFMIGNGSIAHKYYQAENRSHENAKDGGSDLAVPKSSDERVADYTWWLDAFTFALVFVSTIQIFFLTRADTTARTSADAAKVAADAATQQAKVSVAIELPIFIIEDARILQNGDAHAIEIRLGNHGRTPAIITADCLEVKIVKTLPHRPHYSPETILRVLRDRVVEPHQSYAFIRKYTVSTEESKSIETGDAVLWTYGFVDYLDFMKREHREGYCLCFFPARLTDAEKLYPTVPPTSLSWARSDPGAYTYNRNKTDKDRNTSIQ